MLHFVCIYKNKNGRCKINNKNRRGPHPKPCDQKRINRINVYLTNDEFRELQNRSGGQKLPAYLRGLGLSREARIVCIPEGNFDLAADLRRIGSNLNQIVRLLNGTGAFDSRELSSVLEHLKASHAALLGAPV